ncbi:hypothetical protein ACQ7CX_22470 [Chryseobacterium arthrosphaerae]|uniref:hypothetical protein n=1 Tax=Chryseobacterium arthrosphaerae TaxID=651561 RepID=UPI001BAF4BF3|nr:hypothetical protein [Chryseobacterium arthrosphaerae]QUY55080.1 hypothetical protein I2F65_19730 [Chryseobacterium arthrosphaerae]
MRTTLILITILLSITTTCKSQVRSKTKTQTVKISTKHDTKSIRLDYLVHLKTTSTFSGVSKSLLTKGFYFKNKNSTYNLFTNGKDEIYYFPGQGNDGSGVFYGDIQELKEKIAIQYMFNSEVLYENLIEQSYHYLGAKLYKQHTEGNGNMITIIQTTDFVFMFGENLEKTDDLNYKVFIISRSSFTE